MNFTLKAKDMSKSTELLVDVAARLLKENGSFSWKTLGVAFYKRKPFAQELNLIKSHKENIVKRLRDRGIKCHLVSDAFFSLGRLPIDEDEARACLPRPKPSAGIRLAGTEDLLYTAFMLCEDRIKRGHVAAHAERVDEAMAAKRLRTTSVFQLNQEKHLSIFLRETPLLGGPKEDEEDKD